MKTPTPTNSKPTEPASTPASHEALGAILRSFPSAIWILFAGVFLNKFGTFVIPFLTLYLTRQGFTPREAGLALGAYGLGRLGAAFIGGHHIHLQPGSIALGGAALLLLLDCWPRTPEEQTHHVHGIFGEVEWITIFFFIGLFGIVAGVEHAGLLDILAHRLIETTGGDLALTALAIPNVTCTT